MISESYHHQIEKIVKSIEPHDDLEASHQKSVLNWIRSGEPLCRTEKPATPPKHLISYLILLDRKREKILLVDHKKALLWLPPGGHIEPNEHPRDTAFRELKEELNVQLPLYFNDPFFLTVTETKGIGSCHTDVSLWYVFLADSSVSYSFDPAEFNGIRWFSLNNLPLEKTDPHLGRFYCKLMQKKEKKLKDLKNVGKATLGDLKLLGISAVDELVGQDPTDLFHRLEKATGKRQDPCVWDVFAAIIHEAETGEATSWWKWTPKRKELQKMGQLTLSS